MTQTTNTDFLYGKISALLSQLQQVSPDQSVEVALEDTERPSDPEVTDATQIPRRRQPSWQEAHKHCQEAFAACQTMQQAALTRHEAQRIMRARSAQSIRESRILLIATDGKNDSFTGHKREGK